MQAAKGATRLGDGEIVLDEIDVDARLCQAPLVVGLAEEAAQVVKALWLQDQDAGEGSLGNIHGIGPELSGSERGPSKIIVRWLYIRLGQ